MFKQNFNELTHDERIVKAKVNLQRKTPFIAHLLARSECSSTDRDEIPLAGINCEGKIVYNEKGVMALKEEELMGLLGHEIFHYIFLHHIRGKNKHSAVWNIATDLVINTLLLKQGLRLPQGGLTANYQGFWEQNINGTKVKIEIENNGQVHNAEHIYYELLKQIPQDKIPQGEIGEGDGFPMPLDTHQTGGNQQINPDKQKEIEREIRDKVSQAETYAKQRGVTPLGMNGFIKDILEPRIPWRVELQQYVQKLIKGRLDWKRPHKRTHSVGYYVPKVKTEKLEIITHIDTSGSMSKVELSMALTECQSILLTYPQVKMVVLVGDTEIQETFELTQNNANDITELVNLKGGGGTSHVPVFEALEKGLEDGVMKTRVLICITDGYTEFPKEKDYAFDTIWLLTNGCDSDRIPFGKVITMRSNE